MHVNEFQTSSLVSLGDGCEQTYKTDCRNKVEKFIEDFDIQEVALASVPYIYIFAVVQFRLLSSLLLHKTQRLINKNVSLYFVRVCNLVSYTKTNNIVFGR